MPVVATLKQISEYASESDVRGHTTLVDRPDSKGGTDRGPMGGEHFLTAVGGCFMSNLLELVRNRGASVRDIEVRVEGIIEGTPKKFTAVSLAVSGKAEDQEEFEKLVLMAERACIMTNTVKDALDVSFSVSAMA